MSINIRAIPIDEADLESAPPEVREVQTRLTALMRLTRQERGERFADLVQVLYAVAQLRLFMHTAPPEFSMIGNALVSQVASGMDKLLGLSGDEIEQAGAVAQRMVDMCLIKRDEDGKPDRRMH